MIKLKHFKQNPSMCGPASLKILLDHYGKNFTEQELIGLCKATIEEGTSNGDMVAAVRSIGLDPIVKKDASIEEIRSFIELDIPVMVGWTSDGEAHFSVVFNIDQKNIFLMDPEAEEEGRRMTIEEFLKDWNDYDSKLGHTLNHWMLTI